MKLIAKVGVLFTALISFSVHASQAADFVSGDITVSDPFARATFGAAKSGGAFLTLRNNGEHPDRLIAIKSSNAKHAGLHESYKDGGIMRMRSAEQLDLPPKSTVELKPGGYHVMLMGLTAPLEKGTTLPLVLKFERAGEISIKVDVLGPGAMSAR